MAHLTLRELGIDPADDAGCSWHPHADHPTARNPDGHLVDLNDDQVDEHATKPEADEQYDGVRHRARVGRELGAAEDSDHSPAGIV